MNSRWLAFIVVAVVLLSIPALSDQKAAKEATESGNRWLALVDSGNYAASWDQAAQIFKSAVPKEQWTRMVGSVRNPLGKLESRKLKSATYKTSLPGAPDGQYFVIQFDSSFEHKKSAVETVTPMLEKDGQWRISGYFIR
jgi:hypothetical protein